MALPYFRCITHVFYFAISGRSDAFLIGFECESQLKSSFQLNVDFGKPKSTTKNKEKKLKQNLQRNKRTKEEEKK